MTATIPLGEAFEFIRNGMNIKQSKDAGGVPITRIETISDGTIDLKRVGYAGLKLEGNEKWLLEKGDLLLSHINSVEHIGKCAIFEDEGAPLIHGMNLLNMRPKQSVLYPRYAMWALKDPSFKNRILRFVNKAVNQASISTTNLKTVEILVPPLDEQKRIAAILDQADALRRLRQRAIDRLNTLGQAIFHEMFSKTIEPTSIQDLLKREYLLIHKDGNHGGNYPRKEEFGEEGVPFLSAKCVDDFGSFIESELQFLNEEKANSLRIGWIRHGDVLLSHNASVGKVAAYRGEYGEALIGTSLTCFRPNPEKLKTDFLAHALQSYEFQSQLTKNMSQTTRNQVPITAQKRLFLSIPPVSDQVEFERRVSSAVSMRSKMFAAAKQTETLFFSLQNRAFRGEL